MNKYLIEFSASVGRKNMNVQAESDAGASMHSPVRLKYYGIVEAVSVEAANDQIVLYRDPGFVTSVVGVTELTKDLSITELSAMLNLQSLITES